MHGKRNWFFPDAELPPMGEDREIFGHESIIVLNPNSEDANVAIVLYWTDREQSPPLRVIVKAGRVRCVRVTETDGILGMHISVGEQYAISLESDIPVVAQYGRLDMRSGNMAFYTTPGYAE